jgi:glycerol uptake facilitator protein
VNPYLAELVGTALLVVFGNGVVANVLLTRTKGHGAGWIVITAGWGLAVFVGAFCAAPFSGAHLNPAVTVGLALAGRSPEEGSIAGYVAAQMLGAVIGAALVLLFYLQHFRATEDAATKLACFCTAPAIDRPVQNLFCEAFGTFCLVLPIFLLTNASLNGQPPGMEDVPIGLGSLGLLPVGLLVFGIGLSLGGTTGYAINPARDLGPRLVHALLPVPGKGGSDWSYAWVPVVGPLLGAAAAAGFHLLLIRPAGG